MMLPVYGPVFLIGDDPADFTSPTRRTRATRGTNASLWRLNSEASKGLPNSWSNNHYVSCATKRAALAARARLLAFYSARVSSSSTATTSTTESSTNTATTFFPTQYDEKKWEKAARLPKT